EIVRLLGGMPLAIELAASRIGTLEPAELLQRLVHGAGTPMLDLLARPARRASADARHASMRHMLGFSWQHLSAAHDHLLQCMSTLQAPASAGLLAHLAGLDLRELQLRIDELHQLSLVLAVHGGKDGHGDPATTYALLVPVREFAAERCMDDVARGSRSKLRSWLLLEARRNAALKNSMHTANNLHLQQALVTAANDGEPQAGLELVVAVHGYWARATLPLATVQGLEKAVELAAEQNLDAGLRAEALDLLAWNRVTMGDGKLALQYLESALALAPAPAGASPPPADITRRGVLVMRQAWVRYSMGMHDEQLEPTLREALALVESGGSLLAKDMVLRMLAMIRVNLHEDYVSAEVLISRCLAIAEELGDASMIASRLVDRATIWGWMGRAGDAIQMFRHVIAQAHADGSLMGVSARSRQLGRVLVRERRWAEAAAAFRESIRAAWLGQNTIELTVALLHLPDALVHLGQLQLTAHLQGFAWARWHQLFGTLNRIEAREVRRTRRLLRLRLGAVEAESARMAGAAESYAGAVALALAIDAGPEAGVGARAAASNRTAEGAALPH
ncbi:MAG: hypothetical protein ABIN96_13900, partial [Rubrivivax sp.]